jgi:hypothetical protein
MPGPSKPPGASDDHKGAVEGDRPGDTQHSNRSANQHASTLTRDGGPLKGSSAVAHDRIGANADDPEVSNAASFSSSSIFHASSCCAWVSSSSSSSSSDFTRASARSPSTRPSAICATTSSGIPIFAIALRSARNCCRCAGVVSVRVFSSGSRPYTPHGSRYTPHQRENGPVSGVRVRGGKRLRRPPQSHPHVPIHVVFSPWGRQPSLS